MQLKSFDYSNPIHQQIGVRLAILYWANGDHKEVYGDQEMMDKICKEFYMQDLDESCSSTSNEEIVYEFLTRDGYRWEDEEFLELKYNNKHMVEKGDDYWDVEGGQYGMPDIDPSGGHGLHSHK
jgi:hypothetical protein